MPDLPTQRLVISSDGAKIVDIPAAEQVVIAKEWTDNTPLDPVAQAKSFARLLAKQGIEGPAMKAVLLVLLDEINLLRSAAKLSPRTILQVRQSLVDKIDSGSVDA